MWISETETIGIGEGAETWYQYDTDSIRLAFDSDNKLSSKDYRYQSDHITVSNYLGENEIDIKNSISGEIEKGKLDIPENKFSDIKEAIKYVNENK